MITKPYYSLHRSKTYFAQISDSRLEIMIAFYMLGTKDIYYGPSLKTIIKSISVALTKLPFLWSVIYGPKCVNDGGNDAKPC